MDYRLRPLSLRKTPIAGPHRPNESEEERNGAGRSFVTLAILFGFSRKTLEGTISCEAMHFFNGKLEQSWNRFDQIVLKPGYRWKRL